MSELSAQKSGSRSARVVFIATMLLTIAVCAFVGYQRAFSVFATYDDEGYVAISLKEFVKGGPLYDEVYSQYGPAWYVCHAAVHKVLNLPVTHDVIRFKTLTTWLLTAFFASLAVLRLTRCKTISVAAFILAFLHLDRLTLEPGHPQEFCVLAVAAILAMLTHPGRIGILRVMGIGAVVGSVVLTKLNVGLLLVASITLAFCMATKSDKWRQRLVHTCLLLIAIAAVVVTKGTIREPRGIYLPILVVCSAASVAWIGIQRTGARPPAIGALFVFHVVWPVAGAIFLLLTLAGGTTPDSLLNGVVLQHLGFSGSFYMSPPLYWFTVLLAIGSVVLAGTSPAGRKVMVRYIRLGMVAIVSGVILRHWTDSSIQLAHGLVDRGHAGLLISFVGPLAWVSLHDSGQSMNQSDWFGRVALACIAALQPLTAYPIPGTQMAVGSLPLLIISVVCVNDLIRAELVRSEGRALFPRAVRFGLLGSTAIVLAGFAQQLHSHRARLEPLNLPGAKRLAVEPERASQLRELVATIRENGDTFVSVYRAYNSLYLLADLNPPNGLNATLWPWMLSDYEQQRIIRAIEANPDVCAIDNAIKVRAEPPTRLGRYLQENFAVHAQIGNWSVMTRVAK